LWGNLIIPPKKVNYLEVEFSVIEGIFITRGCMKKSKFKESQIAGFFRVKE